MQQKTIDYWQERWRAGDTGFHLHTVHPWLEKYYACLQLKRGAKVFLPLSGKSLDILFFLSHGINVLAVEVSEQAVLEFIEQHTLTVSEQCDYSWGKLIRLNNLHFIVADFFKVPNKMFQGISAIYDRAAFIALDKSDRKLYIDRFHALFGKNINLLLITLAYNQQQMAGPPYSVDEQQVEFVFQPFKASITVLDRKEIIDQEPSFQAQGLDSIITTAYHVCSGGRGNN